VARKKGFLMHGGIPNTDLTCRAVMRDFLSGKIPYHTEPPQFDDDAGDDVDMD
jgi:ribosome biogenesis GTPase A